jgi:Yip1 domain
MIKALLLIFRPVQTWGGIDAAKRSIAFVLCVHVLPLLLITSVAEGYGLMTWGKQHKGETSQIKTYELGQVVVMEVVQSIAMLGMIFLGAFAAKSFAETFHKRNKFREAFTAVAYGASPLLLMRLGDLFPSLNVWVPWAVGIVLMVSVLYLGLPCLLRPDPPHAFGLYVMTSLTLVVVNAIMRLFIYFFHKGNFPKIEQLLNSLGS